MTEEIIVDGVNVVGCFNLDEWKHCNICQELIKTIPNRHQCLIEEELRCEFYTNCYYKQRKRLEQDSKQLTQWLDEARRNADFWCDKCTSLEQENKELKDENERLKKDFSSYEDDIEDWVSDNSILYQYDDRTPDTLEELQACMESVHEQWQKYKQALKEIRILATKNVSIENFVKIQNKINEVLK